MVHVHTGTYNALDVRIFLLYNVILSRGGGANQCSMVSGSIRLDVVVCSSCVSKGIR